MTSKRIRLNEIRFLFSLRVKNDNARNRVCVFSRKTAIEILLSKAKKSGQKFKVRSHWRESFASEIFIR